LGTPVESTAVLEAFCAHVMSLDGKDGHGLVFWDIRIPRTEARVSLNTQQECAVFISNKNRNVLFGIWMEMSFAYTRRSE
jgi:hypothetical protein